MVVSNEKNLKIKGYVFYKSFYEKTTANECARKLREEGCFARVLEQTTSFCGLHKFSVYYKKKIEC